jgi:branched-chain amino acid transport system ATP-binding protein
MVEHDMGVVFELADKVAVLVNGQVMAFDAPNQVRENPRVQEAYLGTLSRGRGQHAGS